MAVVTILSRNPTISPRAHADAHGWNQFCGQSKLWAKCQAPTNVAQAPGTQAQVESGAERRVKRRRGVVQRLARALLAAKCQLQFGTKGVK
jgi:hypothetical protein